MKTFKPFLTGIKFILRTDHQPLKYLYEMRNVDSRLARTLNDLLEYDFEIEYLPGKDNVVADHLSRNIVNSEMEINDSVEADFSVLLSPPGGPDCMLDCLFYQIQRSLSLNNT